MKPGLSIPIAAALCVLASCAGPPLSGRDCVAVAPPVVTGVDRATATRASELIGRSITAAAASRTRLSVVVDPSACDGRTAVIHSRVESFEPPSPGFTGCARSRFLVTDVSGRTLVRGRALSLSRFIEGADPSETLASSIGLDAARFLRAASGPGPALRPDDAARERVPEGAGAFPSPRDWRCPARSGRFGAGLRLFMLSAGGRAAGLGVGAPTLGEAFSPAPGIGLCAWWSVAPGLALEAALCRASFAGKVFESQGLKVEFDDLTMTGLSAGARLLLPLSSHPVRWWSSWEPFADTRGLNALLTVAAGFAASDEVGARIIDDSSGETPALETGSRIPYYRRGVTGFCEAFTGLEARFGRDGGPVVTAALCMGFFASGPPPSAGAGSRSDFIAGPAVRMEAGVGF